VVDALRDEQAAMRIPSPSLGASSSGAPMFPPPPWA